MAGGGALLDSLTKGARAAFPFLSSLAATELSPTQIITQARLAGFSFRTQQGFDIIALLRDNQSAAQYVRSQAADVILNPSKFGTAPFRQLRKYRYTVVLRGVNPDTAETVNQTVVVSSDQLMSKNQIINKASEYGTDPNSKYYMEVNSADVTDALVQGG